MLPLLIVRDLSPAAFPHAETIPLSFCLMVAVEVASDDLYEPVIGPVVENVITPELEVLDEDVASYELLFAPLVYVIVTVNVVPDDSRAEQLSESRVNFAVPADDVTAGLPPEQPEPLSVTVAVSEVPVALSVKGGSNLIDPVRLLQL